MYEVICLGVYGTVNTFIWKSLILILSPTEIEYDRGAQTMLDIQCVSRLCVCIYEYRQRIFLKMYQLCQENGREAMFIISCTLKYDVNVVYLVNIRDYTITINFLVSTKFLLKGIV